MKKRNGFTLVELLTVLVILGMILGIGVPVITRMISNSKNEAYRDQVIYIEKAAKNYVDDQGIYVADGETALIELSNLCSGGFLKCPVNNPQNGKPFDGIIKIDGKGVDHEYQYIDLDDIATTPPRIKFSGSKNLKLIVGTEEYIETVTAKDIYNITLVVDILIESNTTLLPVEIIDNSIEDSYTITYTAEDERGNVAIVTREVEFIIPTAPDIILAGLSTINLLVGETYIEQRATIEDDFYDDVELIITGDIVDTSKVGTYTIFYNATNPSGLPAIEKTRTIDVKYVLDGWSNRIELIIDADNIPIDLEHFPLTIFLENDHGTNKIFDEIETESNKMAFTMIDGETELFAEIEEWDAGAKTAIIHVSHRDFIITKDVDTKIYLYYDKNVSPNTAHIGTYGSTVGREVWNDNYILVGHMADSLVDSTGKNNFEKINQAKEKKGQVGKAMSFDGKNDYMLGTDLDEVGRLEAKSGNPWTVLALFNSSDAVADDASIVGLSGGTGTWATFGLFMDSSKDNYQTVIKGTYTDLEGYENGVYKTIGAKWDGNNGYAFVDKNFTKLNIGTRDVQTNYFGTGALALKPGASGNAFGKIYNDETRISNISRTNDWINAEYDSLFDALITY